ncbi:MAG: Enoyl-CoA hydratase [Aeromicrobium sp.]|nr:Enoyl-CoA hydratase [Aeromicrobium sp.]
MIVSSRAGDVAVISIDRHDRRNALDVPHLEALTTAVRDHASDGVRAMVVTGVGSAFSAGADLDGVYGNRFRDALYTALGTVVATPVPVIAAVNGPAIGAGAQLAIACDLRVASPEARFSVPTARNGLAVNPWTVKRLALLSNGGVARSLLLGCESLDADRALSCGLVDRLGDVDAATGWADDIAKCAPLTLSYSKRALNELFEGGAWSADLDMAFDACWGSDDFKESVRARADKRAPVFEGR